MDLDFCSDELLSAFAAIDFETQHDPKNVEPSALPAPVFSPDEEHSYSRSVNRFRDSLQLDSDPSEHK